MTNSKRYEVEWCSKMLFDDETGEMIVDAAEYSCRHFLKEQTAATFGKQISSECFFGSPHVYEQIFNKKEKVWKTIRTVYV